MFLDFCNESSDQLSVYSTILRHLNLRIISTHELTKLIYYLTKNQVKLSQRS